MGFQITGQNSFIHLGSFAVPQGTIGSSSLGYVNGQIAYRPESGTLFIVGHDQQQMVMEISIPALKTGTIANLNTATTRQTFSNIYNRAPSNVGEVGGNDTLKVGGLFVLDNKLIGTEYIFYDAEFEAVRSHYVMHGMNTTGSPVSGTYKVGTLNAGYYAGYMGDLPSLHSGTIGKQHFTAQSSLSIITRTSFGPALFGVNLRDLFSGPTGTVDVVDLIYYTDPNPIQVEDTTNPIWNTTSYIRGCLFPSGSDTVLFFGSHGTGFYWYGSNGDISGVTDPARSSQGPHAYPYRNQIWAYPVSGIMKVLSGITNPWEAPYSYWEFTTPYGANDSAKDGLTVAYDTTGNRLFIMEPDVDSDGFDPYPIIHVYSISGVESQQGGGSPLVIESGVSYYLRSGLLEHVFRQATINKPTAWLGLATTPPTKSGTFSELSATGNYKRVAVTGNDLWSNPSGGSIYNVSAISFGAATSTWVPISGWGIFDQSGIGLGNMLYCSAASGKTIGQGDTYQFSSGTLSVNMG